MPKLWRRSALKAMFSPKTVERGFNSSRNEIDWYELIQNYRAAQHPMDVPVSGDPLGRNAAASDSCPADASHRRSGGIDPP